MNDSERIDFYTVYPVFRQYDPPDLKAKHVRQFDAEFWRPAACDPAMSVMEIGSGTGLFLAYLADKGVGDFVGLDFDAAVEAHIPDALKPHIRITDVWNFLDAGAEDRTFDRVALFDVLEHFTPDEGVKLLRRLAGLLRPGGKIVVRVPNMSSPWGLQYQFHDLTHKAQYTPGSLRQLALAAGFKGVTCLPQKRRRGWRRLSEDLVHLVLSRLLTEAPAIWSANFIAVLERGEPADE